MKLLVAVLFLAVSALAECRDNCGEWIGGCEFCHIQEGKTHIIQEGLPDYWCEGCGMLPDITWKQPKRLDLVQTVKDYVFGSLSPVWSKPSGNLTVRQHEELMRKALLFGIASTPCPQFTPGTMALIRQAVPRVQLASIKITQRGR